LPAAAKTTTEALYKDLFVRLEDGSDRLGAIRSVVRDKYFIVHIVALLCYQLEIQAYESAVALRDCTVATNCCW